MTFITGEKTKYGWHVYSTCWSNKLTIAQVETKEDAIKEALKVLKSLGFTNKNMDFNHSKEFRFSYF